MLILVLGLGFIIGAAFCNKEQENKKLKKKLRKLQEQQGE